MYLYLNAKRKGIIMEKSKLETIIKKENMGSCLNLLMVAKNIKVKEFSEKLMVSSAFIHAVIINYKKPSIRLLRDMLVYLEISEDDFIEIIDYYNNYKGDNIYTYALLVAVKKVIKTMESPIS